MKEPYYITLTGSRNNAGDFLIRHRGHALLQHIRPDRRIVDRNAWEPITEERLEEINGAEALILLGGPALRRDMYPSVYPLVPDLSEITTPISIMGAGWHATPGTWEDSRTYRFTGPTATLLQRVAADGAGLSVRDYRSLNTLHRAGVSGALMTGCPALYVPEKLGTGFTGFTTEGPQKIVFSLGVNFIGSAVLQRQVIEVVEGIKTAFPAAELTVAFHHSIDFTKLTQAYGSGQELSARKHREIVRWLEEAGITYLDISGGVDRLIQLYTSADFHIGYRVHAHIFMSSQRKASVLITEDGRGRALKEVLGGVILDSYENRVVTAKERILAQLGWKIKDRVVAFSGIADDVADIVNYESIHNFPRFSQVGDRIDRYFPIMESYINGLP